MKRKIFFLSALLYLNSNFSSASEVVAIQIEKKPIPEKEAEIKKVTPKIKDRFLVRFEKMTRIEKGL